ncbi:hypothetical protein BUALT_Bualt17G0005400 [Buddleja alternifolia]|uniref:Thioredoxin domain-containing protein n=1 Tax=Buddleja alternifolia TaxID=168488 RepID=A0AAV6WFJ0_9LAMI|nr:hypothetical protein BUALT_Bualt17G0005400 [Buddleja alternifolia]
MCICMSNLNHGVRVLLLLAALALFSIHTGDGGGGGGGAEVQWQILTKLNYSSQIRLHPRFLLLVTVPWSGESRSLMKELAHVVASDQVRFGTLRLMVLYRNAERLLADALGATDGISIFYYHDTLSYKYWGKLRVQNIVSSMHYVMSLLPDDLPLKSLTTPEELKDLLDSTDKAVLLLEFCGWTPRLLGMNTTMTENDFCMLWVSFVLLFAVFGQYPRNRFLTNYDISKGYPKLVECIFGCFVKEASCSLNEFQSFELFLQKFIRVARDIFLPPETLKFALVRERSLCPLLNIEEPDSWLLTVQVAGCPTCSKILKEGDDLTRLLQQLPIPEVAEFEDDPHGVEAALPAKRPTMLLFVDRSSNLMQIRRESQLALNVFRELAQHHEMTNQIHGQDTVGPDKTSVERNRASSSTLKHPRLQPFPTSQKLMVQDKMSIVIMKEGQQVTLENLVPDLQSSSVHEILSYALKRKKELKLSSLARDAGFQLLSRDFDIEVVESVPQNSDVHSNRVLGEIPVEVNLQSADLEKHQLPAVSSSGQHEEQVDPSGAEYTVLENKEDSLDKSSESSVESEHVHHNMGTAADNAHSWNVKETSYSGMDENEQQKDFRGSFLFLDGQYRLLEILTGGSKIPSFVIIDPISQEHYVLDGQSVFSYPLLSTFVNDFFAGQLPPYLQSNPIVPSHRDARRPPFVNLDFHETASIPLVTPHTFPELVLGNKSDPKNSGHSWDRNILVLFSNSWCGFCQRMELVVREVYRAINSYEKMKINSSRKEKLMLIGEYVEDVVLKLPLIYMMDCTRNDCSLIVKSTPQREVYPLLLLFPAGRKNDTVAYEGDIAVSDIIKFLAAHGNHVLDLIMDKGFIHGQNSIKYSVQSRSLHHEVLLKDRLQNVGVKYNPVNVHFADERPQLFAGCILSASEKLLEVHPFDESKILIVKVDEITGFQGLIINKHISWESVENVEGLMELVKEAPLSFGGPVMRRGMPLVALTHKFTEHQYLEVLPNVYFIDQLATRSLLEEIKGGKQSVHDYWFFLGYSSWGWEQLFNEIAQGAWNVSKGSLEELGWPWR